MLIKCCLLSLGIVLYCLIIDPLLSIMEGLFLPNTRVRLNQLSTKQSNQLINQILDWCVDNIFLKKGRRTKPNLLISKRTKTNYLGSYKFDSKRITIYILKHSSIEELCDTIIHEYVHHLQLRSLKDGVRYNKLTKQKTYWDNDYEVEARSIASKYSKKCMKSLEFW
jgi:hypothetical protein